MINKLCKCGTIRRLIIHFNSLFPCMFTAHQMDNPFSVSFRCFVSSWTRSATVLVIHLAFHAWNPTCRRRAGGRAGNTPTSPNHPSRRWREDGRAATTEARRQGKDRPLHPRRHARSGDIRESEELSHAFCVAPSLLCTFTLPSWGEIKCLLSG